MVNYAPIVFVCLTEHYDRHTICCVRSEKIPQYIVFQLLTFKGVYYTIKEPRFWGSGARMHTRK